MADERRLFVMMGTRREKDLGKWPLGEADRDGRLFIIS